MECLNNLVGLKGGCAEVTSGADVFINSRVTYSELSDYIDQKDHISVDELFDSLRKDAAREVLDEIQSFMQPNYIARTVRDVQTLGAYNKLTTEPSDAIYKGVQLEKCSWGDNLAYRVGRIGFISQYTGNVVIKYFDGITGEELASDTIAAIAGKEVSMYVNRFFAVDKLNIFYDATSISSYRNTVDCYITGCVSCKWKINAYSYAYAKTASLSNPVDVDSSNSMGGLIADVSLECDHTRWLCGIRQYLSTPMMWKVGELILRYAIDNSMRANTRTVRDVEKLVVRAESYRSEYQESMQRSLKRIQVPNDPMCYNCKRKSGIFVAIP
jgi:hypothetical protein